jgi:hypothetical protein
LDGAGVDEVAGGVGAHEVDPHDAVERCVCSGVPKLRDDAVGVSLDVEDEAVVANGAGRSPERPTDVLGGGLVGCVYLCVPVTERLLDPCVHPGEVGDGPLGDPVHEMSLRMVKSALPSWEWGISRLRGVKVWWVYRGSR